MTGSPAAIEVQGVSKHFGAKVALDDVNLIVHQGELLGLVGPNGAGKSTLLRMLVGLVQRTSGSVSVFGLDPDTASLAIRRRSCYLPGETSVYRQMTGQQFLDFALAFHPRLQRELLQRLQREFDLPLRQKVRGYSAGMKQKLALMAVLVPDVELYLLDEPDRGLDASVRFQLRELLRELHQQGRTVVLSSHHLAEVEALADRLEFLVEGRNVAESTVAAARATLRRRLRLKLRPGKPLPGGARRLATEADGTEVLDVDGEPLAWLRQLAPPDVLTLEHGVVRLEELYQLLAGSHPAGTAPAGARP